MKTFNKILEIVDNSKDIIKSIEDKFKLNHTESKERRFNFKQKHLISLYNYILQCNNKYFTPHYNDIIENTTLNRNIVKFYLEIANKIGIILTEKSKRKFTNSRGNKQNIINYKALIKKGNKTEIFNQPVLTLNDVFNSTSLYYKSDEFKAVYNKLKQTKTGSSKQKIISKRKDIINKIWTKKEIKVKDINERTEHFFTTLYKQFIPLIKIDKQITTQSDIIAAQPTLLYYYLKEYYPKIAKQYKKYLNGDFYQNIADKCDYSRDEIKSLFTKTFFTNKSIKVDDNELIYATKGAKLFIKLIPEINGIFNKDLPNKLTNLEAEFINTIVNKCLKNNIKCIPNRDEVIYKQNDANKVIEIINSVKSNFSYDLIKLKNK